MISSSHAAAKPQESGQGHLGYLDALRGLAALFVVLHHSYLEVWPTPPPPGLTRTLTGWLDYGHFAVDLFIVLSGFCLMMPVARGDGTLRGGVWVFFTRRARRILPSYYAGLALSLLLIMTVIGQKTGTHWDMCLPVTVNGILAHVLLLQDVFPETGAQINHTFWSISVEWRIYFLFPLLVWGWRRFGAARASFASFAVSYAAYSALFGTPLAGINAQFLGLFTLGMLGATFAFSESGRWPQRRAWRGWGWVGVVTATAIAALNYWWGWDMFYQHMGYVDGLVGLCAMCLLVVVSRPGRNVLRAALSWEPLVALGTFAYSLYLVHAPLIQVLWQYVFHPWGRGNVMDFLMLAFIGTPIIVGASYLFFLVAERPFLSKRPGETLAQNAREAALVPAP